MLRDANVLKSARNELSNMASKQAKTLSTDHIDDLLFFAERSRHPLRNRLVVLLSVKAGLRAAEILKLTWDMVLNPSGQVGTTLELQDRIAKKGGGCSVPLHAELRQALIDARGTCGGQEPVFRSKRGGPITPLSIVVWFSRAYRVLGFDGCALRSPHLHHARRPFDAKGRRLAARRSTAGGTPIDPNDPGGTSTATQTHSGG